MMADVEDTTFEVCATRALRFVTDLNRRGIKASVHIDDNSMFLTIPAYGAKESSITAVNATSAPQEFDELLALLQDALAFHVDESKREEQITDILDTLSYDQLKLLADEPNIQKIVKSTMMRSLMRYNSP